MTATSLLRLAVSTDAGRAAFSEVRRWPPRDAVADRSTTLDVRAIGNLPLGGHNNDQSALATAPRLIWNGGTGADARIANKPFWNPNELLPTIASWIASSRGKRGPLGLHQD